MSLLDRTWQWTHRFGGFGVIVVDDLDTILQRLSVAYLDEAVAVATTDPYLLTESGHSLCRKLLRATPQLCVPGGGRWSHGSEEAMTTEEQLAALLADNEDDWTPWMPYPSDADHSLDTPWQRARAAADNGDAPTLRGALGGAHSRYSPAGSRALTTGVLSLLLARLTERQTTNP